MSTAESRVQLGPKADFSKRVWLGIGTVVGKIVN